MSIATLKSDGTKVYVCQECCDKLKQQELPKCKQCSKELNLPFVLINYSQGAYCLDCWKEVEEPLRDKQLICWCDKDKKVASCQGGWNKDKKAWIAFNKEGTVIYQPPQEEEKEPKPNPPADIEQQIRNQPIKQTKKVKGCDKCLSHVRKQIANCRGWEKQRKAWFENVINDEKSLCFCKKLADRPTSKKIDQWNYEPIFYESTEIITNTFCPRCNNPLETRGYNRTSPMIGEVRKDPDELDCPLFEEHSPCMSCAVNRNNIEPRNQNRPQLQPQLPPAKPSELCEKCGIDCRTDIKVKEKGRSIIASWITRRIRVEWHSTNFTVEKYWFGRNCSCFEDFKRSHQQNCPQCNKIEWPDMRKGWLLDYEIKKAFCSPICHVKYREAQWARENKTKTTSTPKPSFWTKKAKLVPMELELSADRDKDFDWEKEGLKKEVLTLSESVKSLELAMKTKSSSTSKAKDSKELEMESYLLELHQNSQQEAEQTYASKYGQTELNALLSGKQQAQTPKMNKTPLIIGGCLIGVGIIGGLVYYFLKVKKAKQN